MNKFVVSKIRNLNFGRHVGRSWENLGKPFVVVYGENEAGKSTLAEFLTWAIGGPWRKAVDKPGKYRLEVGDNVYGDLLGSIGDKDLEIKAQFRILDTRSANDLREALFERQNQTEKELTLLLGDIDPIDYSLIYRLYGVQLGEIGSAKKLDGLFSTFAMGSTASTVNPRAVLKALDTSRAIKRTIETEKKQVKDIQKQIDAAMCAPEDLEAIELEIRRATGEIARLSAASEELVKQRELLNRLIAGQTHINEKTLALINIQKLSSVTAPMASVAENLVEIEQALIKRNSASDVTREVNQAAEIASAACSFTESSLRDRTFSPVDRTDVVKVARAMVERRAEETETLLAISEFEGKIEETREEIESLCTHFGITEPLLDHLDSVSVDLPGLVTRADRWAEETTLTIDAEAILSAMTEAPTRDVYIISTDRGIPPLALSAGFLLVALAGFWQPIAGIVLGLVLASAALFYRRQSRQTANMVNSDTNNATDVASAQKEVARHRASAGGHLSQLQTTLGPLCDLLTSPDSARDRLSLLILIAARRSDLRTLSTQLFGKRILSKKVQESREGAEKAAFETLSSKGIPMRLVDQEFEVWLAKYEAAVAAVSAGVAARKFLDDATLRLSTLLQPITTEVAGLEESAVVGRIRAAAEVATARKVAEKKVYDADLAIAAASLDSEDATALLLAYDDTAKLNGFLEEVKDDIADKQTKRDSEITRLSNLKTESEKLEQKELIPELSLIKGQHMESIDSLEGELLATATAYRVLSATIDRYERENQDPVITAATKLIESVVPTWGKIMFSRDAEGQVIIERADALGRLGEDRLSDGARSLLYLAIRLAFAKKDAEKRGIALPIICDDPLINFDEKRSLDTLRLLSNFSTQHQVILFTCHARTRDAAAQVGATIIDF